LDKNIHKLARSNIKLCLKC